MQILRDRAVEDEAAERGADDAALHFAVLFLEDADVDGRVQAELAVLVGHDGFVEIAEVFALAGLAFLVDRQIEGTEHHVLRRHGDGLAVDRL